jgi:hypothetical protein
MGFATVKKTRVCDNLALITISQANSYRLSAAARPRAGSREPEADG